MTLDGKTADGLAATAAGSRPAARGRWSTSSAGRMDAILVGIGTALADDPQLTARPPGPRTARRGSCSTAPPGSLRRAGSPAPPARSRSGVAVTDRAAPDRLASAGRARLRDPGRSPGTGPSRSPLLDELGRRGHDQPPRRRGRPRPRRLPRRRRRSTPSTSSSPRHRRRRPARFTPARGLGVAAWPSAAARPASRSASSTAMSGSRGTLSPGLLAGCPSDLDPTQPLPYGRYSRMQARWHGFCQAPVSTWGAVPTARERSQRREPSPDRTAGPQGRGGAGESLPADSSKRFSGRDRRRSRAASSATALAIKNAQVRKDLAFFGQFGYPGIGYRIEELITALRHILGIDHDWPLALVGLGNLGRALLEVSRVPHPRLPHRRPVRQRSGEDRPGLRRHDRRADRLAAPGRSPRGTSAWRSSASPPTPPSAWPTSWSPAASWASSTSPPCRSSSPRRQRGRRRSEHPARAPGLQGPEHAGRDPIVDYLTRLTELCRSPDGRSLE